MQQAKTIDSANPSGKVTKRVNNNNMQQQQHPMANEQESAMSSTDHQSS